MDFKRMIAGFVGGMWAIHWTQVPWSFIAGYVAASLCYLYIQKHIEGGKQ